MWKSFNIYIYYSILEDTIWNWETSQYIEIFNVNLKQTLNYFEKNKEKVFLIVKHFIWMNSVIKNLTAN